ncbi:hypothetical protein [Nocardioides sp.]|uniref:hypothetical protein n=1 Tax=Nocardioides sp. TaxID=35761 RepID=UPI003D13D3FE
MEIVELRIHGVHGTSPGAMLGLGDSEVGQVAGDQLTGIYRARDGVHLPYRRLEEPGTGHASCPHPGPPEKLPISVEAYSWGALTSGVQGLLGWVKRALWLLLLPFALVNLAYWARLNVGTAEGKARWGARAVRTSGLLLTVFLILGACVVSIDMVGWQCYRYGVVRCGRLPDQLDFMAALTSLQRLAVGSVAPMLLIGVLWLLSRKTLMRYEAVTAAHEAGDVTEGQPILRVPGLWSGGDRTEALQRLHLSAAIATVVMFSGLHVIFNADGGSHPALPWRSATPGVAWSVWLAAAVLALTVFLITVSHETDLEHRPLVTASPEGPVARLVWRWVNWTESRALWVGDQVRAHVQARLGVLTMLTLGVYAGHVAALWLTQPPAISLQSKELPAAPFESGDFWGHNVWFIGVFILLTALHLTVFVGGRMPTLPAVLVVLLVFLSAGLAAEAFVRSQETGRPLNLGVASAAVTVAWVLLISWHWSYRKDRHTAWKGAGASVLLAAGTWIALLFSTSVVITAADYLNGTEHSVADLVTGTPTVPDPVAGQSFTATGPVTVRGVLELDDGSLTVSEGSVTVAGLGLAPSDPEDPVTYSQGTTEVDAALTVLLDTDQVSFEDSCLAPLAEPGTPCTAESQDFAAGGVLALTSTTLTIDPDPDHPVRLVNTTPPHQPLVVPQVLIWTPMGQLLWLMLVLAALGWCILRYAAKAGSDIRAYLCGPTPAETLPVPEQEKERCARARERAGLAHRAERILDVIGVITAPIALLIIAASSTGEAPWARLPWTRGLAAVSLYAVTAMAVGLVLLGSQIRRSENARKAVGVLWDLTTFWPRAAHPLAPPCYAERVVPELIDRTRWAFGSDPVTGELRNRVILSGHSQGSLIVVAAASRLEADELRHLRIITYGSQVRALYGRVFPCIFGASAVGYDRTTRATTLRDATPDVPVSGGNGPAEPVEHSLRRRLEENHGAWVNLFRRTDPLGYRVFSDEDSVLDLPVLEVPREALGDPGPRVMTHSGYQHTPEYRLVVAGWTGEEFVPDPSRTTSLPILPPL